MVRRIVSEPEKVWLHETSTECGMRKAELTRQVRSRTTAALRGAEVIVSSAPSHVARQVMTRVSPALPRGALVVSVSKGLEPERLTTLSCVLGEVLPPNTPLAVLSGPSFAQEVYQHQPTAVVA